MPDDLFAVPRLARIYDAIEGARPDLDHYEAIVDEFGARSVLDVGCGTGVFALRLAARGIAVTGVDPAAASLEVARSKPGADRVTWVLADGSSLPEAGVDLAVMTGNVAMVFVDDTEWASVLRSVRGALHAGGVFVMEAREPGRRAWEEWRRDQTYEIVETHEGPVEYWVDVTDVSLPFVEFVQHYVFADGAHLESWSRLRFRSRDEVEQSLIGAGFELLEVRDAPDRPGREHVFLTRAT
ncbi:MAG: class I SAM-dependent methyltransferase [Acidimicrobiales bacterium]